VLTSVFVSAFSFARNNNNNNNNILIVAALKDKLEAVALLKVLFCMKSVLLGMFSFLLLLCWQISHFYFASRSSFVGQHTALSTRSLVFNLLFFMAFAVGTVSSFLNSKDSSTPQIGACAMTALHTVVSWKTDRITYAWWH
jgi:hypothetical protein